MPLSIMEARACGLPVLTTDYGSVNYFFGKDNGGIIYASPKDFLTKLTNEAPKDPHKTIPSKINEINELFYTRISQLISK
jgi:glycosyltransferase involved in cell wall biosynthesis